MTLNSFLSATATAAALIDKKSLHKARLLAIVADEGNPLTSHVAKDLGITHAALSLHVDDLVDRGLITKTRATTKGKQRSCPLAITKPGREILQKSLNPEQQLNEFPR